MLIATGAAPIRLDIPGADRILYLRKLRDSRDIIDKTKTARKAVVIGASFIGLEVAASLITRGLQVSVVAPEKLPLERVLGADLGNLVRTVHQDKGVQFHLERTVKAVEQVMPAVVNIATETIINVRDPFEDHPDDDGAAGGA